MKVLSQTREHTLTIEQTTRLELQDPIDRDAIIVHRPPLNGVGRAGHVVVPVCPLSLLMLVHVI